MALLGSKRGRYDVVIFFFLPFLPCVGNADEYYLRRGKHLPVITLGMQFWF